MKLLLGLFLLINCIFLSSAQENLIKKITVLNGLPSNNIKCIFKDSRGYFWIGTEAGLCKYDGKHLTNIGENQGLKYDKIWSIVEDRQHVLWLSVYGEGLLVTMEENSPTSMNRMVYAPTLFAKYTILKKTIV